MPAPDTIVRTPTSPNSPDRAHGRDRAHAFFWCVLVASATVSVTGNAVHAVLHAPVPPIALLTAVHGVTVLQRKQVRTTAAHRLAAFAPLPHMDEKSSGQRRCMSRPAWIVVLPSPVAFTV